jgi:uncharacterized membrane protein YgaE (UPF0421/DUF939 family)
MKQTAVEQLEEYLTISLGKDRMRLLFNEFEKAKAMEKEQIIEAYCNGDDNISAQQYYNETFKSE